MATGDKLVTLDGLKAVYDKVDGDVGGLKSAIGEIEGPATSADEGKSLLVKTVSNGKVTEWEYGEATTLDDTLTQEGQAADAKAVGDALGEIISSEVKELSGIFWHNQNVSYITGNDVASALRLSNVDYIFRLNAVSVAEGYEFEILAFDIRLITDQNNGYVGVWNGTTYTKSASTWYSSLTEIPLNPNYKYKIVAKKTNDAVIAESDANNITVYVVINVVEEFEKTNDRIDILYDIDSVVTASPGVWINGNISYVTGAYAANLGRITNETFLERLVSVFGASGYDYEIAAFDKSQITQSSNGYVGMWTGSEYSKAQSTWFTGKTDIPLNTSYQYKIVIKKTSGGNLAPAEGQNIVFTEIRNPYQKIVLTEDEHAPMTIYNRVFDLEGNNHCIDLGTYLTGSMGDNYIEIPYIASTDSYLYKVCIAQTLPVEETSTVISTGYNTTLWATYNDHTKDFRIKPVLSSSDLASTDNSFYYDGTTIYVNLTDPTTSFVLGEDESNNIGLKIMGSSGRVSNLTIKYSRDRNCYIGGSNVTFDNCHFLYSSIGSSCIIGRNSTAVLNNCEAFKSRLDGFDTTSDETVSVMTQNNCHAHYCLDDGSSHHNGIFYINGGEYDHNVKGGISAPCYGSKGNISGAYIHDNAVNGIYAMNRSTDEKSTFIVSNCLFKGNSRNFNITYYDAIAYNCVFADTPPNANIVSNGTLDIVT